MQIAKACDGIVLLFIACASDYCCRCVRRRHVRVEVDSNVRRKPHVSFRVSNTGT
ncbi:hypothetical protein PF005_g14559 [Phytophthora fragariae]|uniref:Secreted protein n=1 Tax=Phytophthora fragariae TaxID=53985 RepID=A0A6A4D5V8_9STRA|nr:hypothetical protein PF003_g9860 [Phytophthora fragariae]KAE8936002.1 hypothetical protein PF009_g14062 [Phytophthora fragariae]KAE9006655.1 hypothetical protein PF011_g11476 [Phytophthora fragariae]KAE9101947.1 hypothetical protein PF007_g14934 [Phytophthora fragariae]KAE9102078.1 hypothetical protein PF010_g14238 [Phytophthora fragariae]